MEGTWNLDDNTEPEIMSRQPEEEGRAAKSDGSSYSSEPDGDLLDALFDEMERESPLIADSDQKLDELTRTLENIEGYVEGLGNETKEEISTTEGIDDLGDWSGSDFGA